MAFERLVLKGKVVETRNLFKKIPFLEGDNQLSMDRLFIRINQIMEEKKVRHVLITMDQSFQLYPGQLEEIGRWFKKLGDAGKELHFYSKNYNFKELYVSSFCNHRMIPEDGTIYYLGNQIKRNYYKGLLDQLGIRVDVYRRGSYKGAADSFRSEKMDQYQTEAAELLLKRSVESFEAEIIKKFNLSENDFSWFKQGEYLSAEEGKNIGIITKIDYEFALISQWMKQGEKKWKKKIKKESIGKGKKIGVLSFDGNIIDGENQKRGPLGNSCGDESMIREINGLRENKKIQGVIFKVNSGGGSASASAEIYHALNKLKEKKPLVVLQTGLAASGGYYISLPGQKIFTQHGTITGSIGVITMLPYIGSFLKEKGINHDGIQDGEFSDLLSPWKERKEKEEVLIMKQIDHIYEGFKKKVVKERKLSAEKVEALSQGRIWSGYDGKKNGICDEVGGLFDAIDYLKELLEFSKVKIEFFPKKKEGIVLRLMMGQGQSSFNVSTEFQMISFDKLGNQPLLMSEELIFAGLQI